MKEIEDVFETALKMYLRDAERILKKKLYSSVFFHKHEADFFTIAVILEVEEKEELLVIEKAINDQLFGTIVLIEPVPPTPTLKGCGDFFRVYFTVSKERLDIEEPLNPQFN